MTSSQSRSALTLTLLAIVAATMAWWYCQMSYRALVFRPDFAFYHQFAARAGNSDLEDRQSFNVKGDNMFGIVGREGERHLHQAIHFEPVKYLDVLTVKSGHGVRLMFLWRSLVHSLPLLVMALAARRGEVPGLLALAGLVYLAFPAFLPHAAFDLRPFQILAPALLALTVATQQRLHGVLVIALLVLLLSAREEALLFAAFALVFLRLWSPERRAVLLTGAAIVVFWTLATLAYMRWTGYEWARSAIGSIVFAVMVVVATATPLIAARFNRRFGELLAILAPAAIVALALVRNRWTHHLGWLYLALDPRPFIIATVVIAALVWLGTWRLRWSSGALLAMLILSLLVHAFASRSPTRRLDDLLQEATAGQIVFDEKEKSNPLKTSVLCDRSTCQAFADFERAFHLYSIFGDSGFPRRGPDAGQIPEWLRQFDRIVIGEDSFERLEPFEVRAASGWSIERHGGYVIASPSADYRRAR